MNLAKFPRRIYTPYFTPIERLDRLTKVMGGPTIYMKRDDMLGLTMGGNKTRKLEFLMADALEKGVIYAYKQTESIPAWYRFNI